jgi:acyl-coenzyme A thioesterase PaaI-like protein
MASEDMRNTSHRDHNLTLDELAGHCFGCGPANAQGLHLEFSIDAVAHTSTAYVNLTRMHEGPPGHIHGGIVATLMDEAMSKLNRPLAVLAMTRNLEVDYLRPSPLGQQLVLTGHHIRREGRKLFHEAELRMLDGTVLARAKGLFIAVQNIGLQERSG